MKLFRIWRQMGPITALTLLVVIPVGGLGYAGPPQEGDGAGYLPSASSTLSSQAGLTATTASTTTLASDPPPAASVTTDPAQEPPAEDERESLLRAAARQAFAEQSLFDQPFVIGLTKIVDDWAFVNVRFGEVEEDGPALVWKVQAGLARWNGTTWSVAVEGTAPFSEYLEQVPERLIAPEARLYFDPTRAGAAQGPGLWLPFPVGQTWKYLAGPTGGPGWDSVDFGPFNRYEVVPGPQPEPTAPFTGRERDVTAAASGVVIDRNANTLVLRHSNAAAWETGYSLLAAESHSKQPGQFVRRGERLGLASRASSYLPGERVRFWLRREGLPAPIGGQILSDWKVFRDNSYRVGPGAGRIVYKDGTEQVDCATVEQVRLDPTRCHVKHFSVAPSPLPTATVALSPTGVVTIPLRQLGFTDVIVDDVVNLYGVQARVRYTPSLSVTVVDAFPDRPGIQVAPGDIFEDTPHLVFQNDVDPEAGVIEFGAQLQVPAPAFRGNGSLLETVWQRRSPGDVQVVVEAVTLTDLNDRRLFVVIPDDQITIRSGAVVSGSAQLQGRDDWSNITVAMAGRQLQTDAAGRFMVGTAQSYDLTLTAPGYLSARAAGDLSDLDRSGQKMIDLGRVLMLGGDATGDDEIDVFDIAFIGSHYGSDHPVADINDDGVVDIFDLSLSATNYNQQGPVMKWH